MNQVFYLIANAFVLIIRHNERGMISQWKIYDFLSDIILNYF